jgi:hypothetical protein
MSIKLIDAKPEVVQKALEILEKLNEALSYKLVVTPPPEHHALFLEHLLFIFKREREYVNTHAAYYNLETPTGRDYLGWTKAFDTFYAYLETKPETITIDLTHLSPRHKDIIISSIQNLAFTFWHRINNELKSDPQSENHEALTQNLEYFDTLQKYVAQFMRDNELCWIPTSFFSDIRNL